MGTRLDVEDALCALGEAGRRLLAVDPERFLRVLSLARAYLSVYELPREPPIEVLARCAMISPPPNGKPSA